MHHRELARAIFKPSLSSTRNALGALGIFNGHLTPALCLAILRTNNTSIEYLCKKLEEMAAGKCRQYSHEEINAVLSMPNSKGLRHVFDDGKAIEEEQIDLGRQLIEEQQQNDWTSLPSTPVNIPPTPPHIDEDEEVEDDEDEDDDEDEENEETRQSFAWIPASFLKGNNELPPFNGHTWFYTIFLRINGAKAIFSTININKNRVLQRKLQRYREAHLFAAQQLDRLYAEQGSVCDAMINQMDMHPELWYKSLGESHYSIDRNYATVTVEKHKCKKTPLELIEEAFPDCAWRPEQVAQMIRDGRIQHDALTHWLDGKEWAPLGADPAPNVESHTLFYGLVYVLNQIHEKMEPYWEEDHGGPMYDALWTYYASFVHIFEFCLTHEKRMDDLYLMTPINSWMTRHDWVAMSDEITPWELGSAYFNTGVFHAGDLPDLYHMLANIPLWGERQRPAYVLGKLYHKALPFACQRRHIFKLVDECVKNNDGIWKIISRISWVMLAGLYPGSLGSFSTPYLGMRHLLHVKALTDSKDRLMDALRIESNSGGGPLIVSSIFGMHILYMASFEPLYLNQARHCVDWDNFERETVHLTNIIRSTITFSDEDPFQITRVDLNKTVKSPSTHVHRLRAKSLEAALMKQCNEHLEKRVLKSRQWYAMDEKALKELLETIGEEELTDDQEKQFFKTHIGLRTKRTLDLKTYSRKHVQACYEETLRAKAYYATIFGRTHFKTRVMNLLMRLTYMQRTTLEAFSVLRLEEYGGICDETVSLLCDLVRMYYEKKCLPQHFLERFRLMKCKDFLVVCFYFNMAVLVETMQFVPLSAEMIKATDEAMMARRYRLYPGEDVPDTMYDVCVSMCCRKISTMMGTGKHGVKMVAYDMEMDSFVCARKSSKSMAFMKCEKHEEEEEEEEEEPSDDSDSDEDEDDDDEEDDEEEELYDADYASGVLDAQNDGLDYGNFDIRQLIPNGISKKSKDKKRSETKERSKELRSERKAWCKMICGQPVLRFSLRGRALIWGNSLEKRNMYLHCPRCGALHMFTILNYAGSETGEYRCNECARKEQMHHTHRQCAYCKQSSPVQINQHTNLSVLCLTKDPTNLDFNASEQPNQVYQDLYFCKQHYRIARRYMYSGKQVAKDELWALIKKKQAENQLKIASGQYNNKKRK